MKDKIQNLINVGQTDLARVLIVGQGYDESDFVWTLKSCVINFVEKNGPTTLAEIQSFLVDRMLDREYKQSSNVQERQQVDIFCRLVFLLKPTSDEPRYLEPVSFAFYARDKLYNIATN